MSLDGTATPVKGLTSQDRLLEWSADMKSVVVAHIGDVPARIEIDFANQAAQWFSLAGTEERSLQ